MPSNEERLIRLEETVVFQERLLRDLNDALTGQQFQIDRLEKELLAASVLIRDLHAQANEDKQRTVEIPPHYL
jgi:SlyX protein